MTRDYTDLIGDDRIDSRDLIEAAQDLRELIEADASEHTEEAGAFLDAVDSLSSEVSEWEYGAALIREDTFEDYARELAEDIGAITGNEDWPCNCIDWERAARELGMDYGSVTFMGHDYYVRA